MQIALLAACKQRGIPVISAAGAGKVPDPCMADHACACDMSACGLGTCIDSWQQAFLAMASLFWTHNCIIMHKPARSPHQCAVLSLAYLMRTTPKKGSACDALAPLRAGCICMSRGAFNAGLCRDEVLHALMYCQLIQRALCTEAARIALHCAFAHCAFGPEKKDTFSDPLLNEVLHGCIMPLLLQQQNLRYAWLAISHLASCFASNELLCMHCCAWFLRPCCTFSQMSHRATFRLRRNFAGSCGIPITACMGSMDICKHLPAALSCQRDHLCMKGFRMHCDASSMRLCRPLFQQPHYLLEVLLTWIAALPRAFPSTACMSPVMKSDT